MLLIPLLVACSVWTATGASKCSSAMSGYVDLSHWINEDIPIWPGHLQFNMTKYPLNGLWNGTGQGERLVMSTHTATHIDAPIHILKGKQALDEIPRENLMGPGVVVNVEDKAKNCADYAVTRQDMLDFEARHGPIPNGSIVLFNTGWSKKWNNTKEFLGTETKDIKQLAYPGISEDGAKFLTEDRNIVGVGMDSISLDTGNTTYYETHVQLAKYNKWGLECVANVHQLPPAGFWIYVFPMKLSGASGAPCRVLAVL